jgi:hypothetical protein
VLINNQPPSLVPTQRKMRAASRLLAMTALLVCCLPSFGQQPSQPPAQETQLPGGSTAGKAMLTVPSGTRILMTLVRPISTKSTKPGDTIYLQTTFPVTAGDKLLIPAGTFLEGTLEGFQRHRNRVELQMQSVVLIFSNGYKVDLAAGSNLTPGSDADIRQEPGHPKAAVGAAAGSSAGGLAIGGLAAGARGAVVGGAIGGPVGFAIAVILLNRGSSFEIEAGSPVELTLEHPLLLDEHQVAEAVRQPNRILAAGRRPNPNVTPNQPAPLGTCFTPEIPGTPPTIVPGAPGAPPTVIPGTPAIPGTPYPCPQ